MKDKKAKDTSRLPKAPKREDKFTWTKGDIVLVKRGDKANAR